MNKRNKYYYIVFIAVCFLIYGNTIYHNFTLDDKIVISENENVQRGWKAIPSIFTHTTDYGFVENKEGTAYRPVTLMSYAVEIGMFGPKPGVHHFFNLLFYTILCLLIYYLLSEILFPNKNKLFSVFITLLFIIHPIHTEIVSNIKSRDEIFSFIFFILSIIFLFRYFKAKKLYKIGVSILFYCLSLFSKENAVTFIFIFPLFIYFFHQKKIIKILRLMIPYVIVLAFFLIIRFLVISGRGTEITYLNNAILFYDGFLPRYAMAFYILLLYLKLLIIPYPLIWDYSYGHFAMNSMVYVFGILSFLIYLAMFVYALTGMKKKNIFAFLILFYLLTLSMVSNIFFYIGSTMSERFLFIPSFTFCIAIIILAGKIFKIKFDSAKIKLRNGSIFILPALFLVLSIYAYSRSREWKSDYTLTLADHEKTHSFRSRISYIELMYKKANELTDNHKVMNDARAESFQLVNDFPGEAEAWYMNGLISMAFGDDKKAAESYKKALAVNPKKLDALNNLGTIYHKAGELDSALFCYNKILEIDSNYYRVYGNIGMIYHYRKQYDKAQEYYQILLKYDPDNATIRRNYEMVMEAINDR